MSKLSMRRNPYHKKQLNLSRNSRNSACGVVLELGFVSWGRVQLHSQAGRLAVDILAARWMKVKLEWMHRVSFGV